MNVLLPRALREPLRSPKPALPLPSQEHFAFSGPSPAASRSISASARAPFLCVFMCANLSELFYLLLQRYFR